MAVRDFNACQLSRRKDKSCQGGELLVTCQCLFSGFRQRTYRIARGAGDYGLVRHVLYAIIRSDLLLPTRLRALRRPAVGRMVGTEFTFAAVAFDLDGDVRQSRVRTRSRISDLFVGLNSMLVSIQCASTMSARTKVIIWPHLCSR